MLPAVARRRVLFFVGNFLIVSPPAGSVPEIETGSAILRRCSEAPGLAAKERRHLVRGIEARSCAEGRFQEEGLEVYA